MNLWMDGWMDGWMGFNGTTTPGWVIYVPTMVVIDKIMLQARVNHK